MQTYIVLGAAAWIGCGVAAYGIALASFQKRFNVYGIAKHDRVTDILIAAFGGTFGPIGLLSALITCRGYGLLFRPLREEEINYGPRES